VVVRKANDHAVEGPTAPKPGNAVAEKFSSSSPVETPSTFILIRGFDSASASLCEADTALRTTLHCAEG
jgi:hypothetical protein